MTAQAKEDKKDKRIALVFVVLSHALVLILFYFFGLTQPDPPIKEMGMPMTIRLGFDAGHSTQVTKTEVNTSKAPLANQAADFVEDVSAEAINLDKGKLKEEKKEKKTEVVEKEPEKEPEVSDHLKQLLETYKNKPNASGVGREKASGNKGALNGLEDGSDTGGSLPGGGSFTLAGRRLANASIPCNPGQEEGVIKVQIYVDRDGKVIRAIPCIEGSTITNESLCLCCKEAALKTVFSSNLDAPSHQIGKMKFVFVLN